MFTINNKFALCSSLIKGVNSEGSEGGSSVTVKELADLYSHQFGYQLRPDSFGHDTLTGLLSILLKVIFSSIISIVFILRVLEPVAPPGR